MAVKIIYAKQAIDDLHSLDQSAAQRIVEKIGEYQQTPNPMRLAKPLSGPYRGLYRFRIGDYRAIFEKSSSGQLLLLSILRIRHRRMIYE